MPVFSTAIKSRKKGQAIFHVDFWGAFGHAHIPRPVMNTWIMAALMARTLKAEDILMTRHELVLEAERVTTTAQLDKTYSEKDIAMADLLCNLQLSSLTRQE